MRPAPAQTIADEAERAQAGNGQGRGLGDRGDDGGIENLVGTCPEAQRHVTKRRITEPLNPLRKSDHN